MLSMYIQFDENSQILCKKNQSAFYIPFFNHSGTVPVQATTLPFNENVVAEIDGCLGGCPYQVKDIVKMMMGHGKKVAVVGGRP